MYIDKWKVKDQIGCLPKNERLVYKSLLKSELALCKKINRADKLDQKISLLASNIKSCEDEIKNAKTRTLLGRVGNMLAGCGAVLLCPISWACAVVCAIALAPSGSPSLAVGRYLFVAPVEKTAICFKRAFGSEATWSADIARYKQKSASLKQERITFGKELVSLQEQIDKIITAGTNKVPLLSANADAMRKRVTQYITTK